jgi:Niemann-Pick C1 protein
MALSDNLAQAENLIASCPACRNNFRTFFCAFTCSPNQAQFLDITATQQSNTGQTAVKSIDFYASERFTKGFFDSCKSVQIGATNGYAMDLIGGGAKNYSQFLKYLGDEKDIGSPFQIDWPMPDKSGFNALDPTPRNCSDNDLTSRCTCIDCPDVCQALPYIPPPSIGPICTIGALSCLSFMLILAYSLAVMAFFLGYTIVTIRQRREKTYERMALSADTAPSPRSHSHGLVGAGSLADYNDGEDSPHGQSESRHLGRGASLLDPMETIQPRQYRLNVLLRRGFYRLGLAAASSPWLTFVIVFTLIGLLNLGWKNFSIETDPVRLWVAPTSESKLDKEYFDQNFGPFYRTEQIFITSAPETHNQANSDASLSEQAPVLSWEHLKYWRDVENDIRTLSSSPNGYTLEDVCFKPAGPSGNCVVQSAIAWFGEDLDDYDEETWAEQLEHCAHSPVDCLPDFQQPLGPHYVLGGVPESEGGTKRYLDAAAMVVTYVVLDSLDAATQAKAMEWERALRDYLTALSRLAPEEGGLRITFSTGVSVEEEINKSTNTDVKIVVLSYLAMFFYVSLTLGSGSTRGEEGIVASMASWMRNLPRLFSRGHSSALSVDSSTVPRIFPRLPRSLFVGSKFTLGLFGIALVILSVSSSVGLFSALGVKVTLIIAEVIPFLVLAVGVDNVFILVHELDRQNLLHGPNASTVSQGVGFPAPQSPTQSHRSPFESSHDESIDTASVPLYLSAEERVARTLAKMGPSILLSSVTETVAFALGALVPMPAVRNFALYAAGSVILNAILQVTVFISAVTLDLKRVEVSSPLWFKSID